MKPSNVRPGAEVSPDRLSLRRARQPDGGRSLGRRPHLFHRALAKAGYVVVSVDNRGTPAPKGVAWRKVVYGAMGDLSSREQAAAVPVDGAHPSLDPSAPACGAGAAAGRAR